MGIEAFQLYVDAGDILIITSKNIATIGSSNFEEPQKNNILYECFRLASSKTLYLVNATIQVALSHHLDDEVNKQLSVATNTATARQLTGQGTLPTEQAYRTVKAMQQIGEVFGAPPHIVIEAAVKQALLDTGVNLEGLLIGSTAMHCFPRARGLMVGACASDTASQRGDALPLSGPRATGQPGCFPGWPLGRERLSPAALWSY